MCKFFSCIVVRDGRILFTEDDSHETIITRAGLRDGVMGHFQRVEVLPPFTVATVDERERAPWLTDEMLDRCVVLAGRVAPARKVYDETIAPARKVYDETIAPARKVYQETRDAAWKVFYETLAPTQKVYRETVASARKVYVDFLSGIEGYLPA